MTNTGYKEYAKLLKITDDGTARPLDINGHLCSESGLPQAFKDNVDTDPDYVAPVYDTTACPIPVTSFSLSTIHFNNGMPLTSMEVFIDGNLIPAWSSELYIEDPSFFGEITVPVGAIVAVKLTVENDGNTPEGIAYYENGLFDVVGDETGELTPTTISDHAANYVEINTSFVMPANNATVRCDAQAYIP